jgi:hypothetical protein
VPGFPIRTSSDPRSVDSSPRHIAASHVLHRLSMPRHPPCALTHLQHNKNQSYIQKLHKQTPHPLPGQRIHSMLATTIQLPNTTPHHQAGQQHHRCCLRTQQCAGSFALHQREGNVVAHPARAHYRRSGSSRPTPSEVKVFFVVLLRKEVIQPHLPVRLPCYDFVPIADPTFDSSPHKG